MSKRKTTEQFIEEAKRIHGDKYDYSLVEYINNESKIKIICKEHGVFEQSPSNHINHLIGSNCPDCCHQKKKNTIDFIKKCKLIHGDKYDYSLVDYKNSHTKVKIICKKHKIFEQLATNHISGNGCPKCRTSKGEILIIKFLDNKNIIYEYQKKFKDCKNIFELPFDFYLPNYNMCIEFDGLHHFKIIEELGGLNAFNKLKHNDKIKDEYCLKNNIHLLRIKYDENITKKLIEFIK